MKTTSFDIPLVDSPAIHDRDVWNKCVSHLRERQVVLPTLAELAEPSRIRESVRDSLAPVSNMEPHAENLFRVHWYNQEKSHGFAAVPEFVLLPESLTGVASPILVALGDRFPMIQAHKVLAAYGCLVPRLVTGRFDPTRHRAIWPSTGNYCRGGVAISRVLGCRGVAVLPEGMSQERFDWLEHWVSHSSDIVRTPGSESNVKEIYDECHRLAAVPENVIFNQFCEFGNHLVHYACTGRALEHVFQDYADSHPDARLAAFVSATGSAGTIGAGDYLKERLDARIVAVEALECPTMLYNGYGEHNIQGIGDKHIPLIHNVMNTDIVVAISDRATDCLNVLFQTDEGRSHLQRERGLESELVHGLRDFGLSSICNVLAAIKVAKKLDLGKNDVLMTVATDGAAMYESEHARAIERWCDGQFDQATAARISQVHLEGVDTDHTLVLSERDRERIFNLGYFTWVEQQGVSLDDFEARRSQQFWRDLRTLLPAWDERIEEMNQAIQSGPST